MKADAATIRQGLIARGLPAHVADGFVMNFQDESGLNPGINEIAPLVPGSRGGFGLYQLTGPRRVAYEQYAQQVGANLADPDAQLDFLMMELQGPESRAAKSIMSANDAGSAAAAIARDFLRPSPEHLQRRVARYTGAQAPQYAPAPKGSDPVTNALAPAPMAPEQQAQPQVPQFQNALNADDFMLPLRRNALARMPQTYRQG